MPHQHLLASEGQIVPLVSTSYSRPAKQTPHASLLYIEDNALNCVVMERLMSRRPGVQLCVAMTGAEGLVRALTMQPALIILDLDLPDMRGDEVLRRLKAGVNTAHIPIIIFTGDPDQALIQRLLQTGAHGYLPKPLDSLQQLLQQIDALCLPCKSVAH